MALYLVQNKDGAFLTDNRIWTLNEHRAARFHDVRGLMRVCEAENLYDALMVVDFGGGELTRISVPVRDVTNLMREHR